MPSFALILETQKKLRERDYSENSIETLNLSPSLFLSLWIFLVFGEGFIQEWKGKKGKVQNSINEIETQLQRILYGPLYKFFKSNG